MLFSTMFLSLFILSISNFLKTSAGTQQLQINNETTLKGESSPPTATLNKLHDVSLNDETTLENGMAANLMEQTKFFVDLQMQLQTIDKKLIELQKIIEEQETYGGNKLTALEFTLNHVMSKVVFMSDNWPTTTTSTTRSQQSTTTFESKDRINTKIEPEILNRLSRLLRHVQNIERDNCRRSSIPAAAGPIHSSSSAQRADNLFKSYAPHEADNRNPYYFEDLLRKLEQRLNALPTKYSNFGAELRQLPNLIKQNGAQMTRILDFMSQMNNEETQRNSLQHMLEYCQGVSDELSTFTGNTDALLKRIESIVQDTKVRIESIGQKIDENDNDDGDEKIKSKCTQVVQHHEEKHGNETLVKEQKNFETKKDTKASEPKKVRQSPNKTGCHDLVPDIDIDGIYAFGIKDLNEVGRDFNERFCTFATDNERAWTVIQRRGPYEIQENFNRSWIDYRNGFGDLMKDFWFGNEFIHRLTYFNNYELLVELESFDGDKMSINYGTFGLDRERVNYNLFIGDYKGPGPDSLSYHNFMDFSTFDRRNDKSVDDCCPCAIGYGSGWWFDNCLEANLNGIYRADPSEHNYVGIIWEHWLGDYSLKATRMLMRPRSYVNNTIGDP